jgi:pimeloyl-ACP methyl ester carboxylesterase
MANDVARFMYQHKIGTATLGGHGLGGKIALAAACHHMDKTTGYFGLATTPMDQYYFEAARELRKYVQVAKGLNLSRGYSAIAHDLKNEISCPKWREIFLGNLNRSG